MGLFGNKKIKLLEEEVKALSTRLTINSAIKDINRQMAIYPNYDIHDNSERYVTTDDIYSIVRMLATTSALIPLRGYEIKDDKSFKELKRMVQPHKVPLQAKALSIKALEDLPEDDPVNELLESPSDILSKFEFFEAIYTHLFLDGEIFLLKERPENGVNAGKPINLLILAPEFVILKVTGSLPRRVVGYDYVINGNKVFENIELEDVIHIKYYNPVTTLYGNELRGLSPIKVLARRLTQLDSNTDVTTAQMQNGGVQTIVYDKGDTQSFDSGGAEISVTGKRKDNFYRFLKDSNNAGAPFFAAGEMGSLNIGSNLADLKIIESSNLNFKKLCNAFGTSDVLFNNGEASTESNVEAMTKRTYTNTTLPNVYRVRDAFIKHLLPDFKDNKKREIREDISEVSELQANSKEMAEWLNVAWWVKPNDKLEMMRFERSDDPMMDKVLIPSGYQTLDDLNGTEGLDLPTDNGL